MAVREFTDDAGVAWTAWNVTPESIHPQTRAEDYLEDCFQLGWLVFERADGEEKRRLCPYPLRWHECSIRELSALLGRAETVPPLRLPGDRAGRAGAGTGDAHSGKHATRAASTDVRTFRYPGGRYWTVCVLTDPDDGGSPRLRFTSGARNFDLPGWPRDWYSRSAEELASLLRAAAPRARSDQVHWTGPRRRWNDMSPA